jgi:histidinol-phosphatase (PHP family)
MYLADYHSHSNASPDAHYTISELAKAAIDTGLRELCVTDHCECHGFFPFDKKNLPEGVDIYFKERILEQRKSALELYGDKIKLPHGIEIAQGHEARDVYDKILSENSFDFIICSLHNLRGELDFYYIKDYQSQEYCEALLKRYISELYETACLPGFDVLAHITYPLRYMRYQYGFDVSLDKYGAELEQIFKVLIEKGSGIELNVSGLRDGGNVTFPEMSQLKLYRACGGEIITIGTDAHKPEYIGVGVERGQQMLREAGFKYFTVYENRKPSFIAL